MSDSYLKGYKDPVVTSVHIKQE